MHSPTVSPPPERRLRVGVPNTFHLYVRLRRAPLVMSGARRWVNLPFCAHHSSLVVRAQSTVSCGEIPPPTASLSVGAPAFACVLDRACNVRSAIAWPDMRPVAGVTRGGLWGGDRGPG